MSQKTSQGLEELREIVRRPGGTASNVDPRELNPLILDAIEGKAKPTVKGPAAAKLYPGIKRNVEEAQGRTGRPRP